MTGSCFIAQYHIVSVRSIAFRLLMELLILIILAIILYHKIIMPCPRFIALILGWDLRTKCLLPSNSQMLMKAANTYVGK
jgi:hypothetical protein